jgi:hypothetical protein
MCFVIADDSVSDGESENVAEWQLVNNGANRDFLRRVNPNNKTVTNIGFVGDGIINVEAMAAVEPTMWIEATSTRRIAIVAVNSHHPGVRFGDVGWSLRDRSVTPCPAGLTCACDNPLMPCPPDYINTPLFHSTARVPLLPQLFTTHGEAGSIAWFDRPQTTNRAPTRNPDAKGQSSYAGTVVDPLPFTFQLHSATLNDTDALSMFPYFPYPLYGAERRNNQLDLLYRLDTERFRTYAGTQLALQTTFGANPSVGGVEIYSRLINDIEAHGYPGAVMPRAPKTDLSVEAQDPHTMRPTIMDVDGMAFSASQPPTLYAIANQGNDPGALLTIEYYDGAWNGNADPEPVRQACLGGSMAACCPGGALACTHPSLLRIEDINPANGVETCPGADSPTRNCQYMYPGATRLRGGFTIPDLEDLAFTASGKLFAVTGQQSTPCVPYMTTFDDNREAGGAISSGQSGTRCDVVCDLHVLE